VLGFSGVDPSPKTDPLDIVKIFMKKRRTYGTTEVTEKYSVSSKRIFLKR
jgi:hypothetical protein